MFPFLREAAPIPFKQKGSLGAFLRKHSLEINGYASYMSQAMAEEDQSSEGSRSPTFYGGLPWMPKAARLHIRAFLHKINK